MGYLIGLMGMWLFCDAVFSISIYLNKAGYHGEKQTWRRDHWIRIIRALCGVALIVIGGLS